MVDRQRHLCALFLFLATPASAEVSVEGDSTQCVDGDAALAELHPDPAAPVVVRDLGDHYSGTGGRQPATSRRFAPPLQRARHRGGPGHRPDVGAAVAAAGGGRRRLHPERRWSRAGCRGSGGRGASQRGASLASSFVLQPDVGTALDGAPQLSQSVKPATGGAALRFAVGGRNVAAVIGVLGLAPSTGRAAGVDVEVTRIPFDLGLRAGPPRGRVELGGDVGLVLAVLRLSALSLAEAAASTRLDAGARLAPWLRVWLTSWLALQLTAQSNTQLSQVKKKKKKKKKKR